MKRSVLFGGAVLIAVASFAAGAETRKSLVASYETLADTILGAKKTEHHLVTAILETHLNAARRQFADKKFEDSAAEMALFANEGDNAVGGIRKRLVEGGHHHNAEGEAKGVYEAGFVVVTKAAKKKALDASAALLAAKEDKDRKAAWDAFEAVASSLVEGK
jgi:hypothetical protein